MNKIKIENKNVIKNLNGDIYKFLSKDSKLFSEFGEIYFSEIKKNKIKAWKMQKKITMNLIVPIGNVKFVFLDRNFNLLDIITIGKKNYKLLNIPPLIWYGFQGLSEINLISNLINKTHNDNDMLRLGKNEINFDWINN